MHGWCCQESKQMIWLGKIVTNTMTEEIYFKIGDATTPPNSENHLLMKAVMKFFAENVGKTLRVIAEEEFETVTDESWFEIGGEEALGVEFEEYLHGFNGQLVNRFMNSSDVERWNDHFSYQGLRRSASNFGYGNLRPFGPEDVQTTLAGPLCLIQ